MDTPYLYARVRFSKQLLERLLVREGCRLTDNEDGEGDMVFHVYAANKAEARALIRDMNSMIDLLENATDDLAIFIDNYDFPEEEASPST